jgi:pilus assembly protein CpaB
MSARSILLIVAALLITAGTAIVAKSMLGNQKVAGPTEPAKPVGVMVMVAQTDIPTGVFIQEGHLGWQLFPDKNVPATYMIEGTASIEDMMGAVVRRGFTAGEPITAKRVVKPGERSFLAAVLRPGYRAMAIKLNATSGVSGLVFPGDRVDLLVSMSIGGTSEDGGIGTHRVSETVLENVRIIAIDQIVDNSSGKPRIAKNATLELTPKQAEMIAIVSDLGRLSLSLRSLAKDEEELGDIAEATAKGEDLPELEDPDATRGNSHTWDNEVSRLVGAKGDTIDVTRGTATSTVIP